jgi:F-type H+-transporting ATPase subunit epsilon
MGNLFNVNIISPLKVLYSGKISSLIAPASTGYLGVLANHAPMVATLASGKIIIREPGGERKVIPYEGKGVLQVLKNEVTLILDYIKPAA